MPAWKVHFGLQVQVSNEQLVFLTQRAHALAAVIRDVPIPPYLQFHLDTINIMRAVRGTTAIEGVNVSTEEVMNIIESRSARLSTLNESRKREEQEVRNAQETMYYVAQLLSQDPDQPVTEALICKLHDLTTQGIDYPNNTPGVYRGHPVNAGDYFPPPSGDEVRCLMSQFISWFNSPPALNWDPVVRAAVAHFYTVSIHPFGDGNGRTARGVESFLLYQGKVNARGFYSLANYYYQHRTEYIWHLDHARFGSEENLTPFVLFAADGLVKELEDVHRMVMDEVRLISFRDFARERLLGQVILGNRLGERLLAFLISLGREPISVAQVRNSPQYRKVSQRTVQRDIAFLRDHDLIRVEDGAIIPNLDVMSRYTAPLELQQPPWKSQEQADVERQQRGPRKPSGR